MEMCANDPGTFVRNGGYHLKEGVELSRIAPSLVVKIGQRLQFLVGVHCRHCTHLIAMPPSRLGGRGVGAEGFGSLCVSLASACRKAVAGRH